MSRGTFGRKATNKMSYTIYIIEDNCPHWELPIKYNVESFDVFEGGLLSFIDIKSGRQVVLSTAVPYRILED